MGFIGVKGFILDYRAIIAFCGFIIAFTLQEAGRIGASEDLFLAVGYKVIVQQSKGNTE